MKDDPELRKIQRQNMENQSQIRGKKAYGMRRHKPEADETLRRTMVVRVTVADLSEQMVVLWEGETAFPVDIDAQ